MEVGYKSPQGTIEDCWQLIYENTIEEATTTITISNLTGDTDEVYLIKCFFKNDAGSAAGTVNYYLRPNNDSGSNYRRQILDINDTVSSAYQELSQNHFEVGEADNECLSFCDIIFYTKSGETRNLKSFHNVNVSGEYIDRLYDIYQIWDNNIDEITSLVFSASEIDGIGIGSYISIYRKT